MKYVRCLNNKSYIHFHGRSLRDESLASLTIGRVYKALPPTEDERRLGELRIIDNEGEDYLYPADYFEAVFFHPVRKPDETQEFQMYPGFLPQRSQRTQRSCRFASDLPFLCVLCALCG
ncbi:MAG: hypothetical protein WAV66_17160 [Anaerolineae bacterium]